MRRSDVKLEELRYTIESVKILVTAFTLLIIPALSAAEDVGSRVSTDDICAVRPDLCGGAPKQRRRPHRVQKKNIKQQDDISLDELNLDQPHRKPASIKRSAVPRMPRHKISFSDYMTANRNNSAIGGYRPSRQDAFQAPNRPVIYDLGDSSGSVRENAPAKLPSADPVN